MAPADLHKLYAAAIGALLLIGGLAWWRHDVGQKAIQAYQLHSLDSTKTKQLDSVASTSRTAQEAASVAQAQKAQALRLVAAGEALRAKTDSIAKAEFNARQEAEKVVKDSAATIAELRAGLDRLILLDRADSSARLAQTLADGASRGQLTKALAASDSALQASQAQVRSLVALTETLTREVGLLKKAQPSTFGNVVRVVGWAGAGFALGHILK